MKTISKYLTLTGLTAVLCLFLALPANAQHGGGGGGHFGGGAHFGGGGHFAGGGHFGGGAHFASSAHFGGGTHSSARVSVNIRPGSGIRGVQPHSVGIRGNGPGVYGHGGRYGHYVWGRHGHYFYNNGYYGSLYYPMLGLTFGYLSAGYYPFDWDDSQFYFSDGFYYQYDNDQYTVVEPPLGAAIKTLPANAKSTQINGQQYYELNGVYYLPVTQDDGSVQYQIEGKDGKLSTDTTGAKTVVPKVGNMVTKLPADCRKIDLNGDTFFVSEDGIYYQQVKDSDNKTAYKIVALELAASGK
ncbi:MAG: hypothetical protein JWP78_3691 [Mucilaginibacter sp.]|nr:hypothetical protein [Mucilaginibacter sp.]